MPNDDFNPDFAKLDGDYQVLTELHGEGDSRTYLARHLRLNRDVTISVFRVADGLTADVLAQFASDSRLLADARHEHIVPVIDGIWLDDRTFAAVRARVRGATLDQSLSAAGPMSIARVASTMHDITDAIAWARDAGVMQRDVAPWDIVFQQGSGRILLSFEPAKNAVGAVRTECDDTWNIRRLAIEMLAGEIDRGSSADDIPVPRSIPVDVADALAAMRTCTVRNANSALTALLTALDASAQSSHRDERTQIVPVETPPVLTGAIINPVGEREIPTPVQRSADATNRPMPVVTSIPHRRNDGGSHVEDAVILAKPSFGFNARLATAIVVIAAVAGLGVVFLNRDALSPTTIAAVPTPDTANNAAGEVALHQTAPSPVAPSRTRRIVSPPLDSVTVRSRTKTPANSAAASTDSSATPRRRRNSGDSTASKKRVVVDSAEEAERQFKRDSAADVSDPCASADRDSQRRCLLDAIDRNDRELNKVYARLIAGLRRQANAASADPDPDTVDELRAEQRKWVDTRDAACRDVGDGALYAKSRAACFAQQSSDRARELQRRVAAIPPTS